MMGKFPTGVGRARHPPKAMAPATPPLTPAAKNARVALLQLCCTNDLSRNFLAASHLVREAAKLGATLAFLPENCAFMGSYPGESNGIAAPIPGNVSQPFCDLARDANVWLSLGGVQEDSGVPKGDETSHNKVLNAHVVIYPSGNVREVYRKVHLFDVDLSATGGPKLLESSFTEPGQPTQCVVVEDTPVGRLGLGICYDMRFPYLFQRLRFDGNADVLTAPSAYTVPTGKAHWHALLRARAIENQCYMVAAAQVGRHWPGKRLSYGHSIAVDAWGRIVADLGGGRAKEPIVPSDATLIPLPDELRTPPTPDAEACTDQDAVDGSFVGAAVFDLDLGTIAPTRAKMPIASHRRPL